MRRRRRTYSAGEAARRRHAWLELVQTSGPFLTLPVVNRVFPDALPEVPADVRAGLRSAVADMLEDGGAGRRDVIDRILGDALDWGDHLRQGHDIPAALAEPVQPGVSVSADFAFYADAEPDPGAEPEDDDDEADDQEADSKVAERGPWRLLGLVTPYGGHPLARTTDDGWTTSPAERLAHLLRARDTPIGVVTDGRWWAIVWAPVGGTTGVAVWDATLWSEEPESLRAFVALLTRARFLAVPEPDTLPALLAESLDRQEEVTETLGHQVRDAVELLLETLDRLDAESGGALLAEVGDDELYDGVVTVMMRIVFLLFAEERRLLPSDDDLYLSGYSVSRLVDQLDQQAVIAGEQTLDHRTGAWHRLLAVSRALHRGVAHEDLRLPAYGGDLFDPDKYPWLEGRSGAIAPMSRPPAIDDRTVLRMLRAVQYVEIDSERRRLTFRALDVEQIGYVYEGLLELEVRTADQVVLGFVRPAKWPRGKREDACEVPLIQVTAWLEDPTAELARQLKSRTGWTPSRVEKELRKHLDAHDLAAIRRAVGGDDEVAEQILPAAAALRFDERGVPAITLPGRRYVAPGTRRTTTGTHYTPRSLAEDVVDNALEPLVYRPGPLETRGRDTWRIRPSAEIERLRVADIAMGSGAFLVAACRYLADRLVEAWVAEGRQDAMLAERRRVRGTSPGDAEVEQVLLDARRRVAEHCLYGVDINPLAVEMAKLSLWLITMDRERPFGFLDDRLVAGDSLLGLASIDQLETLHVDPAAGRKLSEGFLDFGSDWRARLAGAADRRRQITAQPVVTIRDVERKRALLTEAETLSESLHTTADAITGVGLRVAKAGAKDTTNAFRALHFAVVAEPPDADHAQAELRAQADRDLQAGRPAGTVPRVPLHWPLAFPEVFVDADHLGFDAIVGNPPFSGGQKQSGSLGPDYLAWLQRWDGRRVKGSADLAARFVLRAQRLLSTRGQLGYIAINTLVQGDTLEVGLLQAVQDGLYLRRGRSSHRWPTKSANLEVIEVWASRTPVHADGRLWLDGEDVPSIGPDLEPAGRIAGRPFRLGENAEMGFQGTNVVGLGFVLSTAEARDLIDRDARNAEALSPYVIGDDLNQRPDSSAGRWIINFGDWPLERAERYVELIDIVRRLVEPQRARVAEQRTRENWWKFSRIRGDLYEAVAPLNQVLATPILSSTVMPVRVPTGPVFGHKCVIFAFNTNADLALMSSAIHSAWAVRYTSTTRRDVSYSLTDVFLTLPRPEPTPELHELGERLDGERRELMLSRGWGLTTTYNHVHGPADRDPAIVALRELHADIDHAVLRAYGWDDLDPQIGHHPTKIGTRWTVGPQARFELLDRLLEENHRRHAVELEDLT
ncbi:MAG: Eco57I restriction-modification methylase domain-containing protein [Jatrophihabitans sp.]